MTQVFVKCVTSEIKVTISQVFGIDRAKSPSQDGTDKIK